MIFNKKTKEDFKNLPQEKVLDAYNKANNITSSVVIRNREDTMINIALNGRGLNVFSDKETPLEMFLKDYNLIPEHQRKERVLLFDTETTDKYNAYTVSIAFIIYNIKEGRVEKEFYSLVNPQDIIRADATEVHGITAEMVADAPLFDELDIREFFDIDMVVGHNVEFDLKVIEREFQRLNKVNPLLDVDVFDTMHMAKEIVQALDVKGKIKNPRLDECVAHFQIPEEDGAFHNALYDTKQCLEVFKKLTSAL